jgi:uncharacterized delta-60 repeat protein
VSTAGAALLLVAAAAAAGSGALDPSFGSGGKVGGPLASRQFAYAAGIQAGGKLVIAGATSGTGSGANLARLGFGLARYRANGALDTSFGPAHTGTVRTLLGPKDDEAYALVVQPDGKLVAAGVTLTGSNSAIAVVRYNADGSRDTSFGSSHSGIVRTSSGSSAKAYAVAVQPDGKIVVAGSVFNGSNTDFALVRYTASGSLDATFGAGGIVRTPVGTGADIAYAVAVQPDGKIVAAGLRSNSARIGHKYDIALVRYDVNGNLDTGFGSGGTVRTAIGPSDDVARALAIQPDGKLVVAGYSTGNGSVLVRYKPDGSPDLSFGSGGKVSAGALAGYRAAGLVLQPNGDLVTANYVPGPNAPKSRFAVTRYLPTGLPDVSFGTGGSVITPTGGLASQAGALVRQADGRLVIVGTVVSNSKPEYVVLARYLP